MSFTKFASGVALAASLIASPAVSQEFVMRLSVPGPDSGFPCKGLFDLWEEKIEAESDGRIDVQTTCGAKLTRIGDTITRVASGVVEAGWDIPNVYGARFSHWGIVGLPGLVDEHQAAASALWELESNGTFPEHPGFRVAMFQLQTSVMLWGREEVPDPTNLDGLKVVSGSALRGLTTTELGGVPLSLRIPEYYQALAKGAADALLTNLGGLLAYSLHEQTPYGYAAPWGAGYTATVINEAWYQSLPDDLKAVIDQNTGEEGSKWASQLFWDSEQSRLAVLVDAGEATVFEVSDEDLAAMQPAFDRVVDDWLSRTENGDVYLDAFRASYGKFETAQSN